MAEIPHITDHGDQAVARLAQQFREGVSVPALVRIHAARLQALEDVFRDLLAKRWIDTAAGAQLDVLGRIVGQPREGRADDVFRIWLRARIRLNLGSGTPEDILAIFAAITQGTATIVLEEQYPAAVVVKVGSTSAVDPAQLAAILRLARPAGVQAVLESATTNDPTSFAFDPNGAGWGTVNAVAETTGALAAGATVLAVGSSAGFTAADTVVVDPGPNEETRVVQAVAAGSITITAALSNAHPRCEIRKTPNTGGTLAAAF